MQARDPIGSYLVQLDFQGTGYAPPLDVSPTDPIGFVAQEAALRGQSVFGALADPPLVLTRGSTPASAGVSDAGVGANPIAGAGVANVGLFGNMAAPFIPSRKTMIEIAVVILAIGIILVGASGLIPKVPGVP